MSSTRVGIVLVLFASCFPETALALDDVPVVSKTKTQPNLVSDKLVFSQPATVDPMLGCPEEFSGECFGSVGNNACPRAYVQVGALFMQQVSQFSQTQPIVVDANSGNTLISTSDLNTNFNPGLQATAGIQLKNGRTVELDYFGLYGGSTTATAVKPDPSAFLIFPNNLAGNVFVDMENTNVNYSSQINSFALNLPCCCGCSNSGACDACACDAYGFG